MNDGFSIDEAWPEEYRFLSLEFTGRLRIWADTYTHLMEQAIRAHAPVETGELARSIHTDFTGSEGDFQYEFKAEPYYARFVVEGTLPHQIWPRRPGGMLHWIDDAGVDVFRRFVNHPGNAPNDFAVDAVVDMEGELSTSFRESFTLD